MSDQESPLKTYRANCHCAAYVYEVTLPEVSTASECNCSVCYKKGALWVFPKPDDVKFVKGDPATLTDYTFGKKIFTHKIRLFQHGQVDIWKLPLKKFDGASLLQPPYEPPRYLGPEPVVEFEESKLYTGSCHCGVVTLALKCKALSKHTSEQILECNCSHCIRAGYVWAYPQKTGVVIEGRKNLAMYSFGKKNSAKSFCKICGVPVHNEVLQPTAEELAAMTDEERDWRLGGLALAPVNLRIINDFDVKELDGVRQFEGYTVWQPPYVEP
ncbi:hypothetical protein NPX13_g8899 [Xylaria arbuscula]|uniref:CENP-V/GFA domain-containing protein n=1 Tax=Xylaria arbuscula TaxID=114810 RepID=A0A9W8TI72_9PEZI|nr:hypothetical protein NPX13_g8899 [Xylaria arbuscula]